IEGAARILVFGILRSGRGRQGHESGGGGQRAGEVGKFQVAHASLLPLISLSLGGTAARGYRQIRRILQLISIFIMYRPWKISPMRSSRPRGPSAGPSTGAPPCSARPAPSGACSPASAM